VVALAQQPGAGKLVNVAVGGNLCRREGKGHFTRELYINMPVLCTTTSPSVLGKGKVCNSGGCAQENSK
jgi:hypothetical protein